MGISYRNIQMVSSTISIVIVNITPTIVRVAHLQEAWNMSIVILVMMLRRWMDRMMNWMEITQ